MKKILLALSGTPFTPTAVKYALELAKAHDAQVTGVTLVDPARVEAVGPVPIGGGAAAHALAEHRMTVTKEHIEQEIVSFEAACRDAGVTYDVDRETGRPMETLTDLWRYHDLTILGVRGLFEYGVVECPADEVIKLIAKGVRPILAVSKAYRKMDRVLVAYNGSMESAKAMKNFVQLNPWPNVKMQITVCGMDEDQARPLLTDAAAYCRAHGYATETAHDDGDPHDVLLDKAAAWNADLIVMGSTARHKIFKFILGDTVALAMREAEIPLFLSQ